MRIEISNENNSEEKVIFNIGTDWKQHVEKNDPNNLFLLDKDTNLEMIQVFANDAENSRNSSNIGITMLAAFTDAKVSLKVKKDNNYRIKVIVQGATIADNTVTAKDVEIYSQPTGVVNDIKDIVVAKSDSNNKWNLIYNVNENSFTNADDSVVINSYLSSMQLTRVKKFTVTQSAYESNKTAVQLIDEKGDIIDENHIGLDFNRDGYVGPEEPKLIMTWLANEF